MLSKSLYPSKIHPGPDGRLHAPAAKRNLLPIREKLMLVLRPGDCVLELASGTGEHAARFCDIIPGLNWQPTEVDDAKIASINAWHRHYGSPSSLRPPILLFANMPNWDLEAEAFDAVLAVNLMHVLDFDAHQTIFCEAARCLKPGGQLIFYGPVRHGSDYFSEGNRLFEAELQSYDAALAIPDVDALISCGHRCNFANPQIHAMPRANHFLVFRKQGA